MEFRILGPLQVVDDRGSEVRLGGAKHRALLAILLLSPGRVVSADRLIDEMWGDRGKGNLLANLQVNVSTLRRALAEVTDRPLILGRSPGYLLDIAPDDVDAGRFDALVQQGRSALTGHRFSEAAALLADALALWRGPALADLADQEFAERHVAVLQDSRMTAIEDRVTADLACGRDGELVAELEILVSEHPLRERLWAHLMVALYRSGRQAEALRAYARARHTLVEEYGIDPGPALRSLEALLLRQDPQLRAVRAVGSSRLPTPLTALIGREQQIAEVRRLLDGAARLVTLTGTGGTGKTRLALAAAAVLAERFPGGAHFVALASVTDPRAVTAAAAQTLGIPESPGEPLLTTLAEALAGRRTLLVFDNCEQIADLAPELAALLTANPDLAVIATSRVPLRVRGEHEVHVPSLSLPGGDGANTADTAARSAAVTLFVARARAVSPAFELTDSNAATVAAICSKLDGLPLAIELAAARIKVLTPQAILTRLAEPLALLVGGARDLPERHQTLRATLDWSWALLSAGEQRLFRRLAAFAGAFTVEVAETLEGRIRRAGGASAGEVLDVLAALVDHGLIRPVTSDAVVVFELVETVRQYAVEQLEASGEADLVRQEHSRLVLEAAIAAGPELMGPTVQTRLVELTSRLPDIRVALRWALDHGQAELAGAAASALRRMWRTQGLHREGLLWTHQVLAQPSLPSGPSTIEARLTAGFLAYSVDDYDEARSQLGRAAEGAEEMDDQPRLVMALATLALVHSNDHEPETGRQLGQRALDIARHIDQDEPLHQALSSGAYLAYVAGDRASAAGLMGEDLALSRRRGDTISVVTALTNLAHLAVNDVDLDRARAHLDEALAIADGLGSRTALRDAQQARGRVALLSGDLAGASESFRFALHTSRDVGQRYEMIGAVTGLAAVAGLEGHHDRAAVLFSAAAHLALTSGAAEEPPSDYDADRLLAARQALGPAAFDRAWAKGSQLDRETMVSFALDKAP